MQKNLLTSIQGLGPKISEKLINHFMTEENVIEAISEARISEIASIKGIGRKLALKIIQEFHSTKDGIYTNQVLMTEDIIRIHNKIIEIIQEYAQTQYVKDRFSLLFPLPSDKIDVIKSRLQYYKQNIDELNKIGDEILSKIRIMLKKVRPIVPVNLIGKLNLNRIVITDDKETYRYLIENRVDRYCKIMLIKQSDIEDSELFKAFDIVILITNSKSKLEFLDNIENSIILDDDWDINDIVPEFIIGNFVGNNYEIIITSYKLIKIFAHFSKKYSVFNNYFDNISMENLDNTIFNLKLIKKDCSICPGVDAEYDKYREILEKFDGIIADQEVWINETIENEIKNSKATIEGQQIFNLLQTLDDSHSISINNLIEILPINISSIIETTISKARENLIEKLNLDDVDSAILFNIYPIEFNFPIEADPIVVKKLKDRLLQKKKYYEFQIYTKIAKVFSKNYKLISKIIQILFKLDELLAIRSFIKDFELKYPNIFENSRGISFKNGKNLFLIKKGENCIPVKYHMGEVPQIFDYNEDLNHDIIILTGANSGGKTTLLQTIAQIIILTQMGLPIPAEANISIFDEIYYFSKSQGVISAGAFETSLKNFTNIIASNKNKIVLLDELEAITEPGAAAKVISSILEMFYESKSAIVILISHLAGQISKIISTPFRIDGIEANGIKDGNLIVDRNPKFNHLAKSMPFFIIQKLYTTCKDKKRQEIYKRMMDYFYRDD